MTASRLAPLGLLLLTLGIGACDQGRERPPDTAVRVINVAPSYRTLDFRREESQPNTLDFKNGIEVTYGEDTYDFNVETVPLSTGLRQRLVSFSQLVVAGTTYAFVLLEGSSGFGVTTLEYPTLPRDATDTQIVALHAAAGAPALDVHIAPPGTNVMGAVPWGTVSFGESIAPRRLPAGQYELTITAAGNPASVLLTTTTFTLNAARSSVFVIAPEPSLGSAAFSVVFVQDSIGSIPLFERDAQASLRAINGAADMQPRDVAVNSQFTPPLFASVPFATPTPYTLATTGSEVPFNVTPPGNPGVLEIDQKVPLVGALVYTAFFAGATGSLTNLFVNEDLRRISGEGKFRVFNAAQQFTQLDFFIVTPGTDVSTVFPITSLLTPGVSASIPVPPGTYDLVARQNGTPTIVAGPTPITIDGGGLYGVIATNGADSATANFVLIDDFQ
jgi:uncharacterized protein DUF4397